MKPSREQPPPSSARAPSGPPRAAAAWISGSSHTDRKVRSSRSPAPSGPAATTGREDLARVDGHLQRGEEEVVLGAEVVVHQRGVDAGGGRDGADRRTPEALLGERRPRGGQDLGPGVRRPGPTAAGRACGHGIAGLLMAWYGEVRAGELQRLAPGRPRARSRLAAPAGVDLQHDVAGEAGAGEVRAGTPRRRIDAAAGHEVLVLGRAGAVGEVDVAQPVAHPVGHLDDVAARDGGVREVDGRVGVAPPTRVPAGQVHLHAAARGGAPRVHVLDREGDAGARLEGRDALDEAGGVVLLPAERRVHDDHVGADRVAPSRPTAPACPTGRCPRPAG